MAKLITKCRQKARNTLYWFLNNVRCLTRRHHNCIYFQCKNVLIKVSIGGLAILLMHQSTNCSKKGAILRGNDLILAFKRSSWCKHPNIIPLWNNVYSTTHKGAKMCCHLCLSSQRTRQEEPFAINRRRLAFAFFCHANLFVSLIPFVPRSL